MTSLFKFVIPDTFKDPAIFVLLDTSKLLEITVFLTNKSSNILTSLFKFVIPDTSKDPAIFVLLDTSKLLETTAL